MLTWWSVLCTSRIQNPHTGLATRFHKKATNMKYTPKHYMKLDTGKSAYNRFQEPDWLRMTWSFIRQSVSVGVQDVDPFPLCVRCKWIISFNLQTGNPSLGVPGFILGLANCRDIFSGNIWQRKCLLSLFPKHGISIAFKENQNSWNAASGEASNHEHRSTFR